MAAAILLLFVFGKMGENPVLSFKQELEAAFLEGGAAAAKERFLKEHEQRKDERLSHELAHWLGAQYYLAEGREGVRFCDETAGFGCFHGFYGMAFANEQDNFLKSASEFCGLDEDRVRFAECVHGIGHGVLVNIGYEEALLSKALDACSQMGLDFFHERFCTSGVFMEYNLRSLQEVVHGGTPVRSFDPQLPYEPCPGLDYPYGIPCYHDLPYWWVAALGPDSAKLGEMCEAVESAEYEESCFRGLGKITPWVMKYQQEHIAQACGAMPHEKAASLCIEEALYVLLYKGEEKAEELCGFLELQAGEACRTQGEAFRCEVLHEC